MEIQAIYHNSQLNFFSRVRFQRQVLLLIRFFLLVISTFQPRPLSHLIFNFNVFDISGPILGIFPLQNCYPRLEGLYRFENLSSPIMLSFLEATTTKHCLQNFVYISVMFEKMTIGKLVSYVLTYLSTSPLKKKITKRYKLLHIV